MGTLVPLSLGTGTFCFFKGPSFSLSLSLAVVLTGTVEFHNKGDFLARWNNILGLDHLLLVLLFCVCVCVYVGVQPIRWALTGRVVSIRPAEQFSVFTADLLGVTIMQLSLITQKSIH